MDSDLLAFGEGLAPLELTEVDSAIALLWFLDHERRRAEASANDLAKLLHQLSLRSKVNVSRLAKNLQKHPDIVRGSKTDSFKLKLGSKPALTARYGPLSNHPTPKVESHVIPSEDFLATRRYLEDISLSNQRNLSVRLP
jgi:hypothetical protein